MNKVIRTSRSMTQKDRNNMLAWIRRHEPEESHTIEFFDGAMLKGDGGTCRTLMAEVTNTRTQEKSAFIVRTWNHKP